MARLSEYKSGRSHHIYLDGKLSFIRKVWLIIYYALRYPLTETTIFYNGLSKYNNPKNRVWRIDKKGNITGLQ